MLTIRRSTKNGMEKINPEAVVDYLQDDHSKLWFHLDTPTDAELQFLQKELKIHPLTVEDIVNQNQRPKTETFENYVYVAIHSLVNKENWEIEPTELDLLLSRQW